ncbi:amyloid-beta A4 precursor protein-binding family A member 2-like isoform X1 [Sabethes cyaneus]|uniref:amyloid-beta A4 precursor protein-binding family A member 2-like isoform X1 n=1 Tax=Sabethes cyaneus TaxID=53552 RepID=UPI00237ED027|nr:amyloid-beta A4 precursor protein-binding family A member 2-like isoform X1 [Sabethes cyaneus]
MSYTNGTQLKPSAGASSTGTGGGGTGPPLGPRLPPPGRPQNYTIYNKDSDRLLWEMRATQRTPNTTPASTVLNSPDLTDLDTKLRYQHSSLMHHHQIKVGRSPVGSGGNNDSNNSTNPSSPTQLSAGLGAAIQSAAGQQQFSSFSMLSDGEMVVFDDIESGTGGGRWRMSDDRNILGSSPVPSENEDSCGSGEGRPDRAGNGDAVDVEKNYYDVDSSKIQRIIGGLTIAEYEGSPRRFGNIDRYEGDAGSAVSKPSGMARPGFPKRVISPCSSEIYQQRPKVGDSNSELINLNDEEDSRLGRKADDRLSGDLNGLPGHISGHGDGGTDYARLYSSMPILEDGLSSGHASDTENNIPLPGSGISIVMDHQQQQQALAIGTDAVADVEQDNSHSFISSIQLASQQLQDDEHQQLDSCDEVQEAIKDIKAALQKTKILPSTEGTSVLNPELDQMCGSSPVWVPRSYDKSRESLDSDLPAKLLSADEEEADTDLETDRLLGQQRLDEHGFVDDKDSDKKGKSKTKEGLLDPAVLIEGVLFRARYLGSTQLVCEGQPTKSTRMMQAEEAVSRIKAPEGESQPSTEVDLFISTEKIMVLNTDLKEIMMDHALRTISYIADIGDLVVLMARRRFVPQDNGDTGADPAASLSNSTQQSTINNNTTDGGGGSSPPPKKSIPRGNRTPKMICHVFESDEAQFIAQSIGQAFQVAYMEFLKANGIEDHSFMKEMDYQEVLNSQEIFGDELEIFAKKELQKEVVVPKSKGEILGVVIVESGWGSMLPTVVIANLSSTGAAARCGQLNIGDQIIAINGLSLVGLPLSTCQGYIKNTKNQTAVKFTVVPCAPVVEVRIKRPNTKYQLGFSVQNGVICSLLRGGIAERGGVRVGHRIIEINSQSVVAVAHEKIVNLLATSVGEIHMKTMPTSMFRLLTGQENPVYI